MKPDLYTKPRWRTFMLGWALILLGSLLAHFIQTAGGITVQEVHFRAAEDSERTLSAMLYRPPGASAESPVPGILAIHGYINSREVQSGFAIEFARRGYVVLAMDQAGHGYSDPPAFASGYGGPAGLRFLRSLPFVDTDNIGLEGHSMGGWAVLAAAAAHPEDYRAMVLEGSSVGAGRSVAGTPTWPRNVAVVFSRFDEFAATMWQVPRGSDVGSSANLQALFGAATAVQEGVLHGDIAQGTARILHSPPVTHPGDHLSRAAIGHALDWFAATLAGGTPLPADDQRWYYKELGTLVALVGFVVLLCGTLDLLVSLPPFAACLRHAPAVGAWPRRTARWWVTLLLAAAIPVATYYPLMSWGGQLLGASRLLPQTITSQIAFWAVVNGLIVAAVSPLTGPGGRQRAEAGTRPLLPILLPVVGLSVATVAMGYVAVLLAQWLWLVDFRFWFVGIKALSATQWQILPVYLLPFTLFFVLTLRALHGGLSVQGDTPQRAYLSNVAALAGGFGLFLGMQYASLFLTGYLLTPHEPLNTIVMIQFVPLLTMVAVISTYAYRRTGSYLVGAFVNALFVSWYIVAGQATQFAVS